MSLCERVLAPAAFGSQRLVVSEGCTAYASALVGEDSLELFAHFRDGVFTWVANGQCLYVGSCTLPTEKPRAEWKLCTGICSAELSCAFLWAASGPTCHALLTRIRAHEAVEVCEINVLDLIPQSMLARVLKEGDAQNPPALSVTLCDIWAIESKYALRVAALDASIYILVSCTADDIRIDDARLESFSSSFPTNIAPWAPQLQNPLHQFLLEAPHLRAHALAIGVSHGGHGASWVDVNENGDVIRVSLAEGLATPSPMLSPDSGSQRDILPMFLRDSGFLQRHSWLLETGERTNALQIRMRDDLHFLMKDTFFHWMCSYASNEAKLDLFGLLCRRGGTHFPQWCVEAFRDFHPVSSSHTQVSLFAHFVFDDSARWLQPLLFARDAASLHTMMNNRLQHLSRRRLQEGWIAFNRFMGVVDADTLEALWGLNTHLDTELLFGRLAHGRPLPSSKDCSHHAFLLMDRYTQCLFDSAQGLESALMAPPLTWSASRARSIETLLSAFSIANRAPFQAHHEWAHRFTLLLHRVLKKLDCDDALSESVVIGGFSALIHSLHCDARCSDDSIITGMLKQVFLQEGCEMTLFELAMRESLFDELLAARFSLFALTSHLAVGRQPLVSDHYLQLLLSHHDDKTLRRSLRVLWLLDVEETAIQATTVAALVGRSPFWTPLLTLCLRGASMWPFPSLRFPSLAVGQTVTPVGLMEWSQNPETADVCIAAVSDCILASANRASLSLLIGLLGNTAFPALAASAAISGGFKGRGDIFTEFVLQNFDSHSVLTNEETFLHAIEIASIIRPSEIDRTGIWFKLFKALLQAEQSSRESQLVRDISALASEEESNRKNIMVRALEKANELRRELVAYSESTLRAAHMSTRANEVAFIYRHFMLELEESASRESVFSNELDVRDNIAEIFAIGETEAHMKSTHRATLETRAPDDLFQETRYAVRAALHLLRV